MRRSMLIRGSSVLAALAVYGCVARAPNIEHGVRVTAAGKASEPQQPPGQPSDEATAAQLQLAREQGAAESQALDYLLSAEALTGAHARAGEYDVAVAIVAPELSAGGTPPPVAALHLAVSVRDAYDARSVPELHVDADVIDGSGRVVFQGPLGFVCDPLLHHYGSEFAPGVPGAYRVRVQIASPRLPRHDPVNGDRYTDSVNAEFNGLTVPADPKPFAPDAARRLALARAQGRRVEAALSTMLDGVAVDGAETRAGDYLVAYAVEYAEGFWSYHGDHFRYEYEVEQSAARNAHVEVAVRDAATGRFVPGVNVTASLFRGAERVGTHHEHLMWHPWIYHYGENWRVPASDEYRLLLDLAIPHCRTRFDARPASAPSITHVEFDDVDVETGQK